MKTIKLKIKNKVDFTKELKLFNSVIRYSFNRFQENLSEKEVRDKVKKLFKSNSWFLQCAIKIGQQLHKKHQDKHIIFGRKIFIKTIFEETYF